jgi:hypothetical protein
MRLFRLIISQLILFSLAKLYTWTTKRTLHNLTHFCSSMLSLAAIAWYYTSLFVIVPSR